MDDQMDGDGVAAYDKHSYSVPTTNEMMSQFDGEDSEDDNEIELELTAEYMTNGYSDMETEDFAAAEENFRLALELVEEHDLTDRLDYGPGDITLVLADCLVRQEKEEEALELLEPIADGSAHGVYSDVVSLQAGSARDGGRDQIIQLKACHTLGLIFLKRADTHAAERRAQQAFKGRRKVCGAHDPTTLDSVQLLIDIYTMKNDKTKARAYRRFLEPNTKAKIGPPVTKISAAPPVLPPVFQPTATATATLTEPAPTILEMSGVDVSVPVSSTEHQSMEPPQDLPQAVHYSDTAQTSTPETIFPETRPDKTFDTEVASAIPTASEANYEEPALQLSDSIRAALQTASISSTLPSPPVLSAKSAHDMGSIPSTLTPAQESVTSSAAEIVYTESSGNQLKSSEPAYVEPVAKSQNDAPIVKSTTSPTHLPIDDSRSIQSLPASESMVTLLPSATTKSVASVPLPETKISLEQSDVEVRTLTANTTPKLVQAATISTPTPKNDTVSIPRAPSTKARAINPTSSMKRSGSTTKALSPRRKEVPRQPSVSFKSPEADIQQLVNPTASTFPAADVAYSAITKAQLPADATIPEPSLISMSKQKGSPTATAGTPQKVRSSIEPRVLVTMKPSVTSVAAQTPSSSESPSATTTCPPVGTISASQAAFAAIFASSGGRPPKKVSHPARTESLEAHSSEKSDLLSTPVVLGKLSSLSQETLTALPITRETLPSRVVTDAFPISEPSRQEESFQQQEEAVVHSRNYSWLPDTKLTMPSSIARVISSSTAPPRSDGASGNILSSFTVKRKAWPLQISKSRSDLSGKSEVSAPVASATTESLADSDTASRRNSVSTLESNLEPKRYISFSAGLTSQPLKRLNQEIGSSIERISKTSLSRSYSSSTQLTPRTRQALAPVFASVKALRLDGKRSAAVDAVLKLLREYDVERRILANRESEIKKNIREGYKGLASTGYGYAPIHFFCDQKTEAAIEIELLLEQSVDVNAVAYEGSSSDREPFTPLQRAVENGHIEIVRLLVDADVAISPPRPVNGGEMTGFSNSVAHPLLLACSKGYTEITKVLLNGGAARLLKEFPHHQWHGSSLLHEACWLADTKMIQMLLDQLLIVRSQYHPSAGPDYESGVIGAPGQQDRFGATPIMYAVDLRDCPSHQMRLQKSTRRKDCLKLLLEHEIHGDLHSQEYRDNIARVLSTKWTRGPGKGHSIFCYCDEAADDELIHLLDPFRYQVSPSARCHAIPPCTSTTSSINRTGSVKSSVTDRQNKMPDFPELMSVPVSWPASATENGEQYELASNFGSSLPEFERGLVVSNGVVHETITEEPLSPVTVRSNSGRQGNGIKEKFGQLSETSERSTTQVA